MSIATRNQGNPPKKDFNALATQAQDRIAAVLPPGMDANRFIQTVRSVYSRTPQLQQCTPESIVKAMIQSAEVGLIPNTALGHAYLIPYKGEIQFQIGYKGLIQLAMQTGHYKVIEGRLVNAKDVYRRAYLPTLDFFHEPTTEEDPGPIVRVYAWARLASGEDIIEVMSRDEVESIRNGSPSKNSPAWRDRWGEMAKKTVLKRMLKRQPLTPILATAFEHDDEPYRDAASKATVTASYPSRADELASQLTGPARDEPPGNYADDDELPPSDEELGEPDSEG